ncbi:MAG TPA: c-type cytochrome [Candidatus Limnocylindrales bacterium]|nr:c-type cytochrome [Candidatus Limnocylindrales bacterium]
MIANSKKAVLSVTVLAASLALAMVAARAQSGGAAAAPAAPAQQTPPPSMAGKKAGEYYKNIQVLKDLDAEKLRPSMDFITVSLGVECEFCHVGTIDGKENFDKDDKLPKATARKMMLMTNEINKANFNGNRNVTCSTCHHGSQTPVSVPAVRDSDSPPPAREAGRGEGGPPPAAPPTADQVLAKFAQAVGGADALAKITTRIEKGNLIFGPNPTPIDLFMKAPDKRVTVSHGPGGDSFTAFDGTSGWLSGRRGSTDMNSIDSHSAMVDAIFSPATDLKKVFPQMRGARPDKIGNEDVYMLLARGPNTPTVRLYFDQQTGLLVRLIKYNDVGLGQMPVQVDYADYREADGIKIPFRWTLSRPNGRFTIQIDSVQQNVPIDDSKFTKPAAPTP